MAALGPESQMPLRTRQAWPSSALLSRSPASISLLPVLLLNSIQVPLPVPNLYHDRCSPDPQRFSLLQLLSTFHSHWSCPHPGSKSGCILPGCRQACLCPSLAQRLSSPITFPWNGISPSLVKWHFPGAVAWPRRPLTAISSPSPSHCS